MNYGRIKTFDVANGEGIRVSLFVSGCRNHCKGCFNEETWDFNHGEEFTLDTINYIIQQLKPSKVKGLTILGGEPLEPENQMELLRLLTRAKGEYPDKDVWIYTGFTWDELTVASCRAHTELLPYILKLTDVLVDGKYVESLRDLRLQFRGSSNQRIINVQESLKNIEIVLHELED